MSLLQQKIVVIGGTGAQGFPIVRSLSNSGFSVVVLTRNAGSRQAQSLKALPNVTLTEGSYQSEPDLIRLFSDNVYGAYVNTDGFAIGEKNEVFWGIRIYELAMTFNVKHYIWGSVPYSSKIGGFDPKFTCGHMDAKGRVTDYLMSQKDAPAIVSVLTSGPYMDMLNDYMLQPVDMGNGVQCFRQPLEKGRILLIVLDDLAHYAVWLFKNPERANMLNLKVATCFAKMEDVVTAFNEIHQAPGGSGKRAKFEPMKLGPFIESQMGIPGDVPVTKAFQTHSNVSSSGTSDSGLTLHKNFEGFFNLWQSGLVEREVDFALLDSIHPGRVKTVKEWMVKNEYDGRHKTVLKDTDAIYTRISLLPLLVRTKLSILMKFLGLA